MCRLKRIAVSVIRAALLFLLGTIPFPAQGPIEFPPYNSYPPPAPPPLPPAGGTFVDPTFGTSILRVTDSRDGAVNHHAYSYWPTFNKDSTRLYVHSVGGQATLYDFDPATMRVSNKRAAFPNRTPAGSSAGEEDATWSWLNPSKMLVHDQDLRLWEYNVTTRAYTLIKDLRPNFPSGHHSAQMHWAYSNDDVTCFTWKDAGYSSLGAGVYKRSTDSVWRFDLIGMDECVMEKTGRYLEMDTGLEGAGQIEDKFVDLETNQVTDIRDDGPSDPNLPGPYWAPGHGDDGAGIRVGYDNWNNRMLWRRHADPGQFTSLLSFNDDWTVGNHASLISDDEGWVTISTFATSPGAPDLWKNQILQAATDGSQRIRRLLHHHSNWAGEYWHTPRASISKDGQFVTFTSNWGNPSRSDVFVARVGEPAGPPPDVPDFTVSATPASRTVSQGGSATYTVTITPLFSFNDTVSFQASGLPAGVTASFVPFTVTGGGSTTLTLSTSISTPPGGPYNIIITGTSGGLIHSTTVNLTVISQAGFSVSATPASRSVPPGGTTTYSVNVAKTGNFSGLVALGVGGLPSGATSSFSPPFVFGSGASTLAISTSLTIVEGSYPLRITGTSGPVVQSAFVTLVVTSGSDFLLSAAPGSRTVRPGGVADYTVSVTGSGPFNGTVGFQAAGLPAGSFASFSPPTVTGSGSSQMRVVTTSSTPTGGPHWLTITGTSEAQSHTASVSLLVSEAAAFSMTVSPPSQTVLSTGSATYVVTVLAPASFQGTITFEVVGQPANSVATFIPPSLGGSGLVQMKVGSAGPGIRMPGGSYPLTVIATSGPSTGTASATLNVIGF